MTSQERSELVDEILSALTAERDVDAWINRRLAGADDSQVMSAAFRDVTRSLLDGDAPASAHWELLLLKAAARSARPNGHPSYEACQAAIDEVTAMIQEDRFHSNSVERTVALASVLVVILQAQRRLRQPIELAIRSLTDKFPEAAPVLADRCQDLWQRHGQMSQEEGLFMWDTRNGEWRLRQDFKPQRPSEASS